MYIDDSWSGKGSHYKFNRADIDRFITRANQLKSRPASTPPKLIPFISALSSLSSTLLPSSHVLVLGSQEPWYESLALSYGASHVTTLEYNNLTYPHPQLTTVTPSTFSLSPPSFDVVIAVAAVDHDGLGRYGDPLAPDGDLLTMDWLKGLVKTKGMRERERRERREKEGKKGGKGKVEGGVLILTAPIGPDLVVWNLERRYGKVRLPLLLEGWEVKGRFGYIEEKLTQEANYRQRFEPAWVLTPLESVKDINDTSQATEVEVTADLTSTSTDGAPHEDL
jgi:hypothetical protein